jgi:hypothetical protein
MIRSPLRILTPLCLLTLIGAGCAQSASNSNSNQAANINTTALPENTNSRTTGTFTTSYVNQNTNTASITTIAKYIYFTPAGVDQHLINIKPNQSISFTNNDTVIHRLYGYQVANNVRVFDATLSPGDSMAYKLTTIGAINFEDRLDSSSSQWRGQIQVQ